MAPSFNLFIHFPVDGYLGCVLFTVIMNKAAMSIRVCVSLWLYSLFVLGKCLEILDVVDGFSMRNCQAVYQRDCNIIAAVIWLLSSVQPFCQPVDVAHQVPLSTGFPRQRLLEWVAISFPRGSSRPRDTTWPSCLSFFTGRFFTTETPGKPI